MRLQSGYAEGMERPDLAPTLQVFELAGDAPTLGGDAAALDDARAGLVRALAAVAARRGGPLDWMARRPGRRQLDHPMCRSRIEPDFAAVGRALAPAVRDLAAGFAAMARAMSAPSTQAGQALRQLGVVIASHGSPLHLQLRALDEVSARVAAVTGLPLTRAREEIARRADELAREGVTGRQAIGQAGAELYERAAAGEQWWEPGVTTVAGVEGLEAGPVQWFGAQVDSATPRVTSITSIPADPPAPATCGARTDRGPCSRAAGEKTRHFGHGRCTFHGG